jgi:hypothetical protein
MGATTAGGREAIPGDSAGLVSADGGTVTIQVEHTLRLVDLAEVLARWASARPPADVDPPASRAEAFEIVVDTLAVDGEQWDRWRGDVDGDQDVEDVVRMAYGWAAEFFGSMFCEQERERLAAILAQEVSGAAG